MAERITLSQVPEGSFVRVRGVESASAARGRLCAFGIIPGAEIEVYAQGAQCRIRVRDASLALCRDLANCIECEASPDRLAEKPDIASLSNCKPLECGIEFCLAKTAQDEKSVPTDSAASDTTHRIEP